MEVPGLKAEGKRLNNFISWKDWRKKRKEENKKWKEAKLTKKIKLDNKSENSVDSKETSVCDEKGRKYSVSIAVPGSILDNAQSPELKSYLAGQIARAAIVFNIDEIVVFDDYGLTRDSDTVDDTMLQWDKKHRGCAQMARILQYLECPQYLRKYLFPMHKDLTFAGLLNPLDAPHHLRVDDESKYREGVVMNKPVREGKGSYVYIGLQKPAVIDKALSTNIRVTVELDAEQTSKKHFKGKAVSPFKPCKQSGLYWGYNVRIAKNFRTVFEGSSYKGGYDLIVGTSDKGQNIDTFSMPSFKHLLIVFGGLQGVEACLEADETFEVNDLNDLFHYYLNTCPEQGSRIIRTEEAILISLSVLRSQILQAQTSNSVSIGS